MLRATAGVALLTAGLVVVTTPMAPAVQTLGVQLTSGSTIGLVIGPSGDPIPGADYVNDANALFIANPLHPNFPDTTYPGVLATGLYTPEGLYLVDGVKQLVFNYPGNGAGAALGAGGTSIGQGVTILDNNIHANIAAGDTTTVFGYSQSTTIAGAEMQQLDPSGTPSDLPVQFVLIGDPNNPNGGLFERFDGLTLASLGLTFNGATPDNDFVTDIYTREYDGFADFPRYPLNLISDLNAFLGLLDVHSNYMPNPAFVKGLGSPSPQDIADATLLSGSRDLGATDSLTNYYLIPTENLPLLDPIRSIPVIGNPLADLLQPDLRVLVNLGYGDPDYGYSTAPANVPTPFGLFPSASDFAKVPELLASGAKQGMQDFQHDLSQLSSSSTVDTATQHTSTALDSPGDIVSALSGAVSSLYSAVLPTADVLNALLTDIPSYNAHLVIDNITDPINAVGLPIAADTAMLILLPGFELGIIENAVNQAVSYFG